MKALLLGSTSTIGRAVARELARDGIDLVLAGRDSSELHRQASDLSIRYRQQNVFFDIGEFYPHFQKIEKIFNDHSDIDEVYCFIGYLGDQQLAETDAEEREKILQVNYATSVHLLSEAANFLERKRRGKMIIFGSVAGDRGRRSNYFYGSAKSGLHTFVDGLRARLFSKKIHVMLVKPGYVDTPMTWGKPGIFWAASPEKVARTILRKKEKGKRELYVPWFWKPIMLVIRMFPESIFMRFPL
ncbi:MAG: SDR family NAD(P)-dependent oxidoreductase [Calditrichaeota bacterium]|nr:MAG: SDR family NAD(P)-dependent oxidoreductase [Calditrichota bacterium]